MFTESTITGANSLIHNYMIVIYVFPWIEDIVRKKGTGETFRQDGVQAHYSHNVRQILNIRFPGHWIGRNSLVLWLPSSPDLTPMDMFWVWGSYLKSIVYEEKNPGSATFKRENPSSSSNCESWYVSVHLERSQLSLRSQVLKVGVTAP